MISILRRIWTWLFGGKQQSAETSLQTSTEKEPPSETEVVNEGNVAQQNIGAGVVDNRGATFIQYQGKKIKKHLGTPPTDLSDAVFRGREEDLKELAEQVKGLDRFLLLVNGEGGIGKTTLATKFYYQHQGDYQHQIWLSAAGGIRDGLLRLGDKDQLALEFAEKASAEEKLAQIMTALHNLKATCLMVLDNADEAKDLHDHLALPNQLPNFHIVVTSRSQLSEREARIHKVGALSLDKAREVFEYHYQKLTGDDHILFGKIYEAVGGNTLVIEVLAKHLHNSNDDFGSLTLLELYSQLIDKGLLQVEGEEDVSVTWRQEGVAMNKAKPEEILSAIYDLAMLDEDEQRLLSIFSLLPVEPMPNAKLIELLPDWDLKKSIKGLAAKGFLDYSPEQQNSRCSPVVQEVTRQKNAHRLEEDGKPLVLALAVALKPDVIHQDNYAHSTIYARYAEAVISRWGTPYFSLGNLSRQLGGFYTDLGNLSEALAHYEKYNDIFAGLNKANPSNPDFKNGLAISYSTLGSTHSSLGDLDKALRYYEQYNTLKKELYEAYPSNVGFKNGLAISYSKLGETHSSLGNLDKALGYYEQYNTLKKELYEAYPSNVGFKNGLAISYSKLGETHSSLGNLDKALGYYEQYNTLEKELYEAYPSNVGFKNGLAISYEKLGSTHSRLGNLDKALGYFEERSKLGKELYEAYPSNVEFKNGLAISYSKLGSTHSRLGNLDKALGYYEQDLQLTKELHEAYPSNVGFKNGLAISYSRLGDTHSSLGNLDKALGYYEQDLQLTKELHEAYPSNVGFKNGLAISYQYLGNTHSSLGDLDKALGYFEQYNTLEKELYEAYPSNVEFKNLLAVSYLLLGQAHQQLNAISKAKEYYLKGQKLYKELVNDFPKNGFQQNLEWANSQLQALD